MEKAALEGQSFLDIALQGGSLENILNIDPNISITDEPVIGENYNVLIDNAPISNYYQRNKIEPATALSDLDTSIITPDDGIGAMSIENTFIVR
ncbi:hypothetical protein J0383_07760 [Flavobacterium endoglycinae]|uniref:Uncharacterized protein n=1 Tax=Flavobacterium endoglycinae TaxID=2816357 RepID=A0ABX7QI02_9FLAO|nr:hypothetical protein [Flavobacterium endoglycinae]QSW90694.1 hypothetical protein J0383_07760 [Flavobacterium endoglycinae]